VEIFVISLRFAAARRRHVLAETVAARVPFRFFDAVDAASEPERHFAATKRWLYRINTRRRPLASEIACYASHLALWRRCVELAAPILILEDDFHLLPSFADELRRLDELAREFGFIRIQSILRERWATPERLRAAAPKVRQDDAFAVHYLSDVPLCMLAYVISPSAAAGLIAASASLSAPVDKFMQRTWEHRVPLFGIEPPLVTPAAIAEHSMIGARPPKSWSPLLLALRSLDKIRGRVLRRRFNAAQLRRLQLERHTSGPAAKRSAYDGQSTRRATRAPSSANTSPRTPSAANGIGTSVVGGDKSGVAT
jgi:glycosyl transferase family 25